jgi:hypothetical protein
MAETQTPVHGHGPAEGGRTTMVSNMLGIAGIIILVIVAIWGLLHLASLTGGWLGSFSPKKSSSIVVTAPKDATSGVPMNLSWKYTPSEKGTYALLYACASGLRLALPSGDHSFVPLPCGAAFTLGNATSSIAVLPLYTGTSTVNEMVTVLYIPSATTTKSTAAQGTATIAIHPGNTPTTSTTSQKPSAKPTATTTKPSTTTHKTVSGPADISVTIVSLTADGYGGGVAVFDIANNGGSESSSYSFTAQVPTSPSYTYVSPLQAPLAPGSHVVNTLNFTQAIPGLFSVTVTGDSTPGNDTAGQYLAVPYYNSYNY